MMLTARGDDLDIVGGLEAGADDYVVKPVEPRVLDARIRAVIRRTARSGSPAETYGELMIDRGSLIVRRAGQDIMLTARGDDLDIVGGLEAGADDYVVKPVEPRVLDARIRAVIRRTARTGSPAESYGELMIDRGSLIVRRAGRDVSLTPTELRLLLVLSGSPRQVFSREQLLDLVWEHDYLGDSRLVDACVQRLRAKIEADTSQPRYIQTARGFGYRFGPV
ncbi:MAG TPA: winged helix-turn-helix domain-containing protein [Streptosporangiaceae bacterium]